MADDDDDISWVVGNAKANNDVRAKLGLPLDGHYQQHDRADDLQESSNRGGGDVLGCAGQFLAVVVVVAIALLVRAVIVAAIIGFVGIIAFFKWLLSGRR